MWGCPKKLRQRYLALALIKILVVFMVRSPCYMEVAACDLTKKWRETELGAADK